MKSSGEFMLLVEQQIQSLVDEYNRSVINELVFVETHTNYDVPTLEELKEYESLLIKKDEAKLKLPCSVNWLGNKAIIK